MKNNRQKNMEEELFKNEPPITANDILAEIKPLLDEYFIGEIYFNGSGVKYCLPNGQRFIIKAEAVA